MTQYFPDISSISFEGEDTTNPLAFRYYDPSKKVLGKTMQDHLRIAVCFWHSFCWQGADVFGLNTFDRPWLKHSDEMKVAEMRLDAGFEFIQKLGVPFLTFHDRDVSPEGKTLSETLKRFDHIAELIAKHMQKTNLKLLWGTANLFSHPRYMAGAATNPDPDVFAIAVAQVKKALDVTHSLNGENYVLWGGREGYETLLNTNLSHEMDQLARFFSMLVEYKHKIGFKGLFLIEPKPCEPTKHQYDYDCATVFAFLQKYGLEKEFKVNIEGNHASLSGHNFSHEVAYAIANGFFGSIDANCGDPLLGWDTDQFPTDYLEMTKVMYHIIQGGGFTSGGFNFDTKLRRQSIDLEDLFIAHISGIDCLAKALLNVEKLQKDNFLQKFQTKRYQKWEEPFAKEILQGKKSFEQIAEHVATNAIKPKPVSGKQELLDELMLRL